MAKFIKLTAHGKYAVYMNPEMISAVEPVRYGTSYGKAKVHTTNWCVEVYETPEQILALINDLRGAA